MEQKKPEVQSDSVVAFYAAPHRRRVPPLSDEEVLRLRQLLRDAEAVFATCPMAQRVLSKRARPKL